jgi:hypothetical protein
MDCVLPLTLSVPRASPSRSRFVTVSLLPTGRQLSRRGQTTTSYSAAVRAPRAQIDAGLPPQSHHDRGHPDNGLGVEMIRGFGARRRGSSAPLQRTGQPGEPG